MKYAATHQQHERHFTAMGSSIGLWLWNASPQRAANAFDGIERYFRQMETRLSRFLPDSELTRLNRAAGQPFHASPQLFALVRLALDWRQRTCGVFDPGILNALLASGYDRPFADMHSVADAPPVAAPSALVAATCVGGAAVSADAVILGPGTSITLPAGLGLDLGGIAKGWVAQQAAHRLGMWGPCLVDAGGDIATVGAPPAGGWVVTVADPLQPARDLLTLTLCDNAVATSSTAYRRWWRNDRLAHHLIDPHTGLPAATDLVSATVVAQALPDAEIHAKTALILGARAGSAYLAAIGAIVAVLVTAEGRQIRLGAWEGANYVPAGLFAA